MHSRPITKPLITRLSSLPPLTPYSYSLLNPTSSLHSLPFLLHPLLLLLPSPSSPSPPPLTTPCTRPGLWVLVAFMARRTSTVPSPFICSRHEWMVMKVPVRPIPSLCIWGGHEEEVGGVIKHHYHGNRLTCT